MNAMGLVYNDQNTTSTGYEINIQTNNAGGKKHQVKCIFCNRINNISIADIKARLELDAKVARAKAQNGSSEEDIYLDMQKGSMLSFRCGACGSPISTTISHKDINIFTTEEYNKEIEGVVGVMNKKVNSMMKGQK